MSKKIGTSIGVLLVVAVVFAGMWFWKQPVPPFAFMDGLEWKEVELPNVASIPRLPERKYTIRCPNDSVVSAAEKEFEALGYKQGTVVMNRSWISYYRPNLAGPIDVLSTRLVDWDGAHGKKGGGVFEVYVYGQTPKRDPWDRLVRFFTGG